MPAEYVYRQAASLFFEKRSFSAGKGNRGIILHNMIVKDRGRKQFMLNFISISDALRSCYDKKGILVDVRSEEAYKNGHLPMAEHVPLEKILHGDYKPEKGMPVFLYCDTGAGSLLAARKLGETGVEAYSVAGGLNSYRGYLEKEEDKLWTMVFVE